VQQHSYELRNKEDFELAHAMAGVAIVMLKKAIKREYGTLDRTGERNGAPRAIHALDNLVDAQKDLEFFVEAQLKLPF